VSLDDRLHQINQSLRLFLEGGGMMFPVEKVCSGKGLTHKCSSSSFYLAFLVIIHGALGIPSGAPARQWESEERKGPHRDWLDIPD
jgi:hypothetical protein